MPSATGSPSPSRLRRATSPKGRGLGNAAELLVAPGALPLGELANPQGFDGEGEAADVRGRASDPNRSDLMI